MKKPNAKKTSNQFLPSEPIEPSDDFADYVKVIYGPKGVGKSTLVSTFPDTLVNMTEYGRSGLRIRQWPDWRTELANDRHWQLTYELEEEFVNEVADNGRGMFNQLALDTVDQLWTICANKVLTDMEITDLSQAGGFGAGWAMAKEHLYKLLRHIRTSGLGLVLVSHVTSKERESFIDDETTETTVPTMDKRAWAWVQEQADMVFLYDTVGEDRVMVIRGKDKIRASCNPDGHFLDPEGEPVNRILMPDDPKKGYATLLAGWNNELPDYDREKARKAAIKKEQAVKKLQQVVKGKK